MIFFKILNFHDISMTGKVTVIFPGFQGFPGAVGTLLVAPLIMTAVTVQNNVDHSGLGSLVPLGACVSRLEVRGH